MQSGYAVFHPSFYRHWFLSELINVCPLDFLLAVQSALFLVYLIGQTPAQRSSLHHRNAWSLVAC